jgi:D-amino-acid oxidase
MPQSDVLVIGAGVSGLTTAVVLAEAGADVRMIAQKPPLETTSAAAGASWSPYMVTDPRVLAWSAEARARFERLTETEGDRSGVRMTEGLEVCDTAQPPFDWATGFRVCAPEEIPPGYATGWRYTIPLIEMPVYLGYLRTLLDVRGIAIERGTVSSWDELRGHAEIVVNCTGLGAAELAGDELVRPVRGQLVVVENPGVDWFFQDNVEDDREITYFLPHGDIVVLGGSAVPDSVDLEPDPAVADAIVARCAAIEPRLGRATRIRDLVGLRPSRPRIRVEREDVDGLSVIHNYGHGGSGVTLSWGCAAEVCRLALAT